jgi:hypothetical protein
MVQMLVNPDTYVGISRDLTHSRTNAWDFVSIRANVGK